MAISKQIWLKARGYFEAGKSLNWIANELEISKSTLSTKAKKEEWDKGKIEQLKHDIVDIEEKNRTISEQNRTITEQCSILEKYQIEILHDLVENETKQKSLIFNGLNLATIRINQQLQKNTKEVLIKTKESFGGGAGSETVEKHQIGLDSSDLRNSIDALTKAGQSLSVISSNPDTVINNAQISNHIEDEIIITRKGH